MPPSTNTYESVGRMFILRDLPDVTKDLHMKAQKYDEKIKTLEVSRPTQVAIFFVLILLYFIIFLIVFLMCFRTIKFIWNAILKKQKITSEKWFSKERRSILYDLHIFF